MNATNISGAWTVKLASVTFNLLFTEINASSAFTHLNVKQMTIDIQFAIKSGVHL